MYAPESTDELWSMIDERNLAPMDNQNWLPYGFFIMSNQHEPFKYINVGQARWFKYLKKKRLGYNYYRLFGSVMLYNYFYITWKLGNTTSLLSSLSER